MSPLRFFLAASFGFLTLLRPAASGHCQTFLPDHCRQSTSFVPGHNLIGEGLDITTLSRKGASVVDTSRWQGPNGTCTLCRNPLVNSELQRLPWPAIGWRAGSECERQAAASVAHSALELANAMAAEVTNDWKADLELPAIQGAFVGSRSKIILRAQQYSRGDSYSFIKHETHCENYQLRLQGDAFLLAPHFSHDMSSLPKEYHREEYQHFVDVYGTHYISQVSLGARQRHLFLVRDCMAALKGLTAFDLKDCLTPHASSNFTSAKCPRLRKDDVSGNLEGIFVKWHTAVMGGAEPEKELFANGPPSLDWMRSAKSHPAVVSYSLRPLHTLLSWADPRRAALRRTISDYIAKRALRGECNQPCLHNGFRSPEGHCTCMCRSSNLNDHMCCARELGKAHLKFDVQKASGLWGDVWSATDGYVKVIFQGQEMRTRLIAGNDHPQWHETLDFGIVTLAARNFYELEVWDSDHWGDEPLHRFRAELKAGGPYGYIGYLTYGQVEFAYELKCSPSLGGPSCQNYSPLKQPASRVAAR